jgi:hypothetical protein
MKYRCIKAVTLNGGVDVYEGQEVELDPRVALTFVQGGRLEAVPEPEKEPEQEQPEPEKGPDENAVQGGGEEGASTDPPSDSGSANPPEESPQGGGSKKNNRTKGGS